jgi:hypothetical protein
MRYIVIANHGAYTAGDVVDFNDDEAAAQLMRTTGVALLRIPDAPPPVAPSMASVPLPQPELRRARVVVEPLPELKPEPEPLIRPPMISKPAKPNAKRG